MNQYYWSFYILNSILSCQIYHRVTKIDLFYELMRCILRLVGNCKWNKNWLHLRLASQSYHFHYDYHCIYYDHILGVLSLSCYCTLYAKRFQPFIKKWSKNLRQLLQICIRKIIMTQLNLWSLLWFNRETISWTKWYW